MGEDNYQYLGFLELNNRYVILFRVSKLRDDAMYMGG
jgi:hypothetical protein